MVRMGNVWDCTTEVLAGRGGMLAGIAIPTLFVPPVLAAVAKAYMPTSVLASLVAAALSIVILVAAIWGQLALIAASSDPATGRPQAGAAASRRFGAAIGVALVFGLVIAAAFLPALLLLFAAHVDWVAIGQGLTPTTAPASGPFALAGLYVMVMGIVLLVVGARLLPLYAVVLHERRGLGALGRTWRLTRGHSWRLIGVVLLFLVVVLVATIAAQSVVGLVARLLLGADGIATATLLGSIAGQVVSTALTIVAIVFSAQAYLGFVARDARLADERARGGPSA